MTGGGRLAIAARRWWLGVPPERLFVFSFLTLIAVGTGGLLWLPGLYTGEGLGLVDALFTATSAACVTGLAVVDTATYFTWAGQAWLLLLIQLGGLGLVAISSFIIGALGRRLSLRTEMLVLPALQAGHGSERSRLTVALLQFTLAAEALFAVILWVQWTPRYGAAEAAWHAVFHAVSAFCNAGFSTFSDSMVGQARSPGVLATLSAAIVVGGIGYLSCAELASWGRALHRRRRRRLSAHTFAALTVTVALLAGGAVLYALMERRGVLAGLPPVDAAMNAWFMSVNARTAGFNSVAYDQLGNGSAMLTMLLMLIGGSPGSTAGGVKTTAVAILVALAWSRSRGRRFVQLHDRRIPEATVQRTVSMLVLFIVTACVVALALALTGTPAQDVAESRRAFLPLQFETLSALGTVGLSMGATAKLSAAGRLVIAASMFVGRVGPLAFFALLSLRAPSAPGTRAAAEDLFVG